MTTKFKWYSLLEIVDKQTGEIITKTNFERRKLIIKEKEYKNEFKTKTRNGREHKYGIKHVRWIVDEPTHLKTYISRLV